MSRTAEAQQVRSGRTRVVGVLLVVVAVLALLYAAAQLVLAVQPGAVALDATPAQPDQVLLDVGDLPRGAQVDPPTTVRLHLADPGLGLRVLVHAPELVGGLGVAAGALLLRRVVRRIGGGTPFAPGTAAAIGWLAGLVLLVGAVVPFASDVVALLVVEHAGLAGPGKPFTLGATLPLLPFALAALVLCVAEAWRRGTALQDDVEGLV